MEKSHAVYFAPLEGVTDGIYRRVHRDMFGGADKYFIPFLSPTQHMVLTPRDMAALSPENNRGQNAVPQILSKNGEQFLWMARQVRDLGYGEVNLNLGCPSGTVTAKGKGSGMLKDLDALRAFLDEIYAAAPIPISIKTRIGFESADEWPALWNVFKSYPISELIIHPRTRSQYYKGTPHRQAFHLAAAGEIPLVYNGDLFTQADCAALRAEFPGVCALMLGRGLIANPALGRQMKGGEGLNLTELRAFHDRLYREYSEKWPQRAVIGHMQEIMNYVITCFENPLKPRKAMHKARTKEAYLDAINWLFDDFALREHPGFTVL